jgi:hypothetical protein
MLKQTVTNLLYDIKDSLGLNARIDAKMVEAHKVVLKNVLDGHRTRIYEEVMRTWEKRYMPSPAVMKQIADGIMSGTEQYKRDKKAEWLQQKQEATTRKQKHLSSINDITQRIIKGTVLPEKQQEAYDTVMNRMNALWDENRSPQKELAGIEKVLMKFNEMTPYQASFVGLLMDWLDGDLELLTGEKFQDIRMPTRGSKPYNEAEWKKDKQRQRSLDYDNNRPGA